MYACVCVCVCLCVYVTVDGTTGMTEDALNLQRGFLVTLGDFCRTIMKLSARSEAAVVKAPGAAASSDGTIKYGDRCEFVDVVIGWIRERIDEKKVMSLIRDLLKCSYNILKQPIFPKSWVYMRLLEGEIAMHGLSWFGSVLKKNYLPAKNEDFENGKELWQMWLGLGIHTSVFLTFFFFILFVFFLKH